MTVELCIPEPKGASKEYRKNWARLIQIHIHLDHSDSQIPPSEDYFYKEPEYPMDAYLS